MSRAALLHIAPQGSPCVQERWPTASSNPLQFECEGALRSWFHKGVSYILLQNPRVAGPLPALAHPESASNQNEEHVMIALGLVRVIERHSDELAAELIAKLQTSSRTTDLRKVPVEELRRGIQEILRHSLSAPGTLT